MSARCVSCSQTITPAEAQRWWGTCGKRRCIRIKTERERIERLNRKNRGD